MGLRWREEEELGLGRREEVQMWEISDVQRKIVGGTGVLSAPPLFSTPLLTTPSS